MAIRAMLLLLCLLHSGLFQSVLAGQLRIFQNKTQELNRTAALDFCRDLNMNLVTLYDEDDATFVKNFTPDDTHSVWVGLRLKIGSNELNSTLKCNAFTNNNTFDCSEKMFFMCQNMTPVYKELNWCLAKQYCQEHAQKDLVGHINNTENQWNNQTFWIGQSMIDDWVWEDNSCSTYRKWGNLSQANESATALVVGKSSYLLRTNSANTVTTLCSKGDLRIVVRNTSKTWEDALNYCNTNHSGLVQIVTREDQEAVEQWLKGMKYEGTFWVGLRQSRVFGFWIWKDRMVDYNNWENNTLPEMPLSYQCGVITTTSYKWSDYDCFLTLPFICQEKIFWLRN